MAMALSPRISFSHDIDLSDPPPSSSHHHSSHNFDFDFDFSLNLDSSSFSPADHLFAHGKLIPLSLLQLNPIPHQSTSNNHDKPIIPVVVPRSCSVGAGATIATSSSVNNNPFPRSRSTGSSYPKYNNRIDQDLYQKRKSSVSSKKKYNNSKNNGYYYSGMYNRSSSTGMRIDPVINVPPPPFIPRGGSSGGGGGGGGGSNASTSTSSSGGSKGSRSSSLFAYLLCNCGDKSVKDVGFCYSP